MMRLGTGEVARSLYVRASHAPVKCVNMNSNGFMFMNVLHRKRGQHSTGSSHRLKPESVDQTSYRIQSCMYNSYLVDKYIIFHLPRTIPED